MLQRDLHEENRLAWNHVTPIHNSHKKEQAQFLKMGGSTLFAEELELLGDVNDTDLVHLQCNSGQDSLSLANLGARVVGVDISDAAISFARELSLNSGIPARFIRADIYDWFAEVKNSAELFNIAFSSYGALVWLSDLYEWARGIAAILRANGRLVVVDFHPLLGVFDDSWQLCRSYFSTGSAQTWQDGVGDYVADAEGFLSPSGHQEGVTNYLNPYPSHEFQWSTADILSSLIASGLDVAEFHEYPFSNGAKLLPNMTKGNRKRFYPPENMPPIPLMFGLVAAKG